MLSLIGIVYAAHRRTQIRKKFGIAGSVLGDFCPVDLMSCLCSLPSSANQCILRKVYLQSNLSRRLPIAVLSKLHIDIMHGLAVVVAELGQKTHEFTYFEAVFEATVAASKLVARLSTWPQLFILFSVRHKCSTYMLNVLLLAKCSCDKRSSMLTAPKSAVLRLQWPIWAPLTPGAIRREYEAVKQSLLHLHISAGIHLHGCKGTMKGSES